MNEWQFQGRRPSVQQTPQAQPSTKYPYDRTAYRAVQESEHRVVEPVLPERGVVHIVGEAREELVCIRNRRDLDQRDLSGDDQIAQKSNVQVQRRIRR